MKAAAFLLALTLVLGAPLEAQMDPQVVPRRPPLAADRDTNSAIDYFAYGMSRIRKEPERAAAAFYWASRIDPNWADPLFGRYVALLLAQPYRLIDVYVTQRRGNVTEPRLRAIDELAYLALLRNPWVDRRILGIVLATWIEQETQGEGIPRYLRKDYPEWAAWLSYNEGKFADAAAEFAAAIATRPDDHLLRFHRALPFVAMGRNDSALAAVRAALDAVRMSTVDSLNFGYVGYPFLEYSLGVLFEREHQPDSARAAYERALIDDLTFYPAHYRLGNLRLMAGDTAGALAEFDQAVTIAPNDPVSLYEFGMLSVAAGQIPSGAALLQRASEAAPFFVLPHVGLGRLYEQSGFLDEAVHEYRTVLRLAPRTLTAQVAAVRERLSALGVPSSAP